jgi:hypothetical protein
VFFPFSGLFARKVKTVDTYLVSGWLASMLSRVCLDFKIILLKCV